MVGTPRSGLGERVSTASSSERELSSQPLAATTLATARGTDPIESSLKPRYRYTGHIDMQKFVASGNLARGAVNVRTYCVNWLHVKLASIIMRLSSFINLMSQ